MFIRVPSRCSPTFTFTSPAVLQGPNTPSHSTSVKPGIFSDHYESVASVRPTTPSVSVRRVKPQTTCSRLTLPVVMLSGMFLASGNVYASGEPLLHASLPMFDTDVADTTGILDSADTADLWMGDDGVEEAPNVAQPETVWQGCDRAWVSYKETFFAKYI